MYKVGLDIHGVCDKNPSFFSKLSLSTVRGNGEVHVITGAHITDELKIKLHGFGIVWTHLFSIADYHKKIGTKIWYNEKGTPCMDDVTWDKTKGDYCAKNSIDMHVDDTERYGLYFTTPFLLYKHPRLPKI